MFGFQTIACLHEIPIVRSSADKLQDVYGRAKDTSVLIRVPCNLAEIVADKSFKVASTIANSIVKPLHGPVRIIDDFAAEKIRQYEAKYPVISAPPEKVMNTLHKKTESARNVMNSVKDTTASTIQHGKETVAHIAMVTINKVTDMTDTIYTFCETHVPGKTVFVHRQDFYRRTTNLWTRFKSTIGFNIDDLFQSIRLLFLWFRMLIVSVLLNMKQKNDAVFHKMEQIPFLSVFCQRVLILNGTILEYLMAHIRPVDRTEVNEQIPLSQYKQQQFLGRQTLKPGALDTTRQVGSVSNQDRNEMTKMEIDKDIHQSKQPYFESVEDNHINKFDNQFKPIDDEFIYSGLSGEIISTTDNRDF